MKNLSIIKLFLALSLVSSSHVIALPKSGEMVRSDIKNTLGFVPVFMKDMPDYVLEGAWGEMKNFQMNKNTLLSGKDKELIGLAVSAQIPCSYCIYAHTEFAKLNGATAGEIAEAVGVAASARHWSTFLNGIQMDETKFRGEIDRFAIEGQKMSANKTKLPQTKVVVIDAESARKDMINTMGFVPEFIEKFPKEGRASAWLHFKNVEMSSEGAIPSKNKDLISLAVSSQIPCRYCIIADTNFAKRDGAKDEEMKEAIAMASVTRLWSTYLNGMQVDEQAFKKDIDTIVKRTKEMSLPTASR